LRAERALDLDREAMALLDCIRVKGKRCEAERDTAEGGVPRRLWRSLVKGIPAAATTLQRRDRPDRGNQYAVGLLLIEFRPRPEIQAQGLDFGSDPCSLPLTTIDERLIVHCAFNQYGGPL